MRDQFNYQLPFIILPAASDKPQETSLGTDTILQRLNEAINSKLIIPLVGPSGSGKSRLVEEFVGSRMTRYEADQVLFVRLPRRLPHERMSRNAQPSLIARTLFSQMLHALRRRSQWSFERLTEQHRWRTVINQDETSTTSRANFSWVQGKVEIGIEHLGIQVIVIDNAHLDVSALDWLIHLWENCRCCFSIVLAATMEINATPGEPLSDILQAIPRAANSCGDGVVLNLMTKAQFDPFLISDVLVALDADVTTEVDHNFNQFVDQFWDTTKGNWTSINTIAARFHERLVGKQPRMISTQIIEEVFAGIQRARSVIM